MGSLVTTSLPTYYTLLRNTSIEHSKRLVTLRHVIRLMRTHDLTNKKTMIMTTIKTFGEHPQIATPETFDL